MKLLLISLAVGLTACSSPAAPDIIEQQPRHETAVTDEASYTKIFLAGTIDMGNSIDWQAETIRRFRECGDGRYLFFNPRRSGSFDTSTENMHYQIRWELDRLERANYILMNILGTSKSPITLLEMGIHIRSGKLYVACEPDFYRYDNVKITCEQYGVPLYNSFDSLLKEVFKK